MDASGWLENAGNDCRYAARRLRQSPGFAAAAILTLALGIGANVAVFTVVQAVLLSPLPYPHPERLVRIYDDLRGSNSRDVGMSTPELWDLRDKSDVFEDISAVSSSDGNLTGGEKPERVGLLGISTNYFTMLAARPALGRIYTASDDQPGFAEGVVLSDSFWRRTFGGDPKAIGKQVRIDGDLYTVLGVMPPDFRHPGRLLAGDVDVWTATGFSAPPWPVPAQRSLRIIPGAMGRLRPGLTIAQAQARLEAFSAQLSQEFPNDYPAPARWGLRLVSVQEDLVGKMRTELFVLFGAVGFVLLIACVNLANLLLARSAGRQREIAVRRALGAGRTRLIVQLLAENVLLALISGGLALGAVVLMKTWLLSLAPPELPRLSEITLSPEVLLFAFAVSILTGLVFGLMPALQTAGPNQIVTLREGSRGSGISKRQRNASRVLVAAEVALSLVLLIGAGLLLRSFWNLLEVRLGFDSHQMITAKIWLPVPNEAADDAYRLIEKRVAYYREVQRRVSALPGVEQVATGSIESLPMGGKRRKRSFVIEGRATESERVPVSEVASVSSGFFDVLKTPLRKGRVFTEHDNSTGQRVAVIDEALAREYWKDSDPIGQHIQVSLGRSLQLGSPDSRALNRQAPHGNITIVGVVGDLRTDAIDAVGTPHIYLPEPQAPSYNSVVYLRTAAGPGALSEALRREIQAVDPTIPVFGIQKMDDIVATSLAARRFALEILGIFAIVAFLLACVGIYGVMAYAISQRTGEMGLRMALGARSGDILRIVLSEAGLIVIAGVGAGLLGSLLLTRFLQTLLFDIKPTDPLTFGALTILLAGVALLASFIPARKASRIDPLVALRHE
jgi:putative ABC transport system permease protein